ncbi:Quinic acid utilization activator [Ceratocystis platani]|uniref:Quinic acid utilization activator n=1 Tax=Ceratocystis fimbriata f. sp. platani TaxID=88771 RepID=A0A0F8AZH0_CERFI|nr:Quinic acid utilization activator [Ceratocystis platani]
MASKRKSQDLPDPTSSSVGASTSTQPATTSATAPAKRQRVSRACDQCRSAREKCDGVQPKCFSCVFLNRQCTYNVAPKKRGVQTGLIRTLESALVWVFDQFPGSEAALNDLLAQDVGRQTLLAQGRGNEAGNKLHKKWQKSRTHREIDRLLSGKEGTVAPRPDGEEESESGTEQDPVAAGSESANQSTNDPSSAKPHADAARRYHVPADAPRLLHIFFSYTHCWLPIVDKPRILNLGSAYAGQPTSVKDLELWCALAVACFQDPAVQNSTKASEIYATALSLLPVIGEGDAFQRNPKVHHEPDSEDSQKELGQDEDEEEQCLRNANGLLLLSLVSFGRDNASIASLLVGIAVRIVLRLHGLDKPPAQPNHLSTSSTILRKAKTTMACFILDTLISLRLGQPPHMTPDCLENVYPLPEDGTDEWDMWEPIPEFSTTSDAPSATSISANQSPPMSVQSLSSLNQLCRFFQILSQSQSNFRRSSTASIAGLSNVGISMVPSTAPGQAAGLASALDSRFSFCNSILGAATPFLPTAFLLQTSFLSITLALMPDSRLSLLWTLMESVENAWLRLGPGSAPVLITYMSMADRRAKGLTGEDKEHWEALIAKLKRPWQAHVDASSQALNIEEPVETTPTLAKTPMSLSIDTEAIVFNNGVSSERHPQNHLQQQQQQQQQQGATRPQYHSLMTPPDLYQNQHQHSTSAPGFMSTHIHGTPSASNTMRTRTASFTLGAVSTATAVAAANSRGSISAGSTVAGRSGGGGGGGSNDLDSGNSGNNSNSSAGGRSHTTNSNGFPGNLMSPMVSHVPQYLMFQGQSQGQNQGGLNDVMIDHDAILNELASIDCTDGMDSDAQFMANLGFAPGSDFTDMRGEFGSL